MVGLVWLDNYTIISSVERMKNANNGYLRYSRLKKIEETQRKGTMDIKGIDFKNVYLLEWEINTIATDLIGTILGVKYDRFNKVLLAYTKDAMQPFFF